MTQGDRPFDSGVRNTATLDRKVHMDAEENLGIDLGTLRRQANTATSNVMPAAFEDEYHVIGTAGSGSGEHRLHRPRRQILAAVFRSRFVDGAIHRQNMAAACFGDEPHAGARA